MTVEKNSLFVIFTTCRNVKEKRRRTAGFGQNLKNSFRKQTPSPSSRVAADLQQKTVGFPIDIEILRFARHANVVFEFVKSFALPGLVYNRFDCLLGCGFHHLCSILIDVFCL